MNEEKCESRPLTPRENSSESYRLIPDGGEENETIFGTVVSEPPNNINLNEPKRDCTLCVCFLVFVSMFLLAGLTISFALLIGEYETITKEKVPQQLYLPGQTTYKLSVNPNEHSGIEFKDTGSSSRKGIVEFISSPQNENNVETLYNMNRICGLPTGNNCTIVRYWPQQMERLLDSEQSYLTCHSDEKMPVHVSWKWISLRPKQNNEGFEFKCPEKISETQECQKGHFAKILTKTILTNKDNSDSDTIVIQFCTSKGYSAIVNYTLHFEEEVPNIQAGQHNTYTMDLSVDTITVPIVGSEQYLYIVTKEKDTTELTLKYISKTTDTQLTNRLHIPQVFYSFLALVAFVCFLQFLVLLLLCKKVKCVRRIYK